MEGRASEPLISVVIPTYNRAALVLAAIDSVLGQEGVALEVIVVDDGSTDATVELLATHPDRRVRVIASGHAGVSAARNRGAAEASGKWLAFLDSDDLADPGWLAAMLAPTDVRTPLVTCAATLRYPSGVVKTPGPQPLGPAFGSITAHFLAGTFAVTTELFRSIGGYLEGLAYGENTELGMRLGVEVERRGLKAAVVPSSLVNVVAHERPYDPERYFTSGSMTLECSGSFLARDPHMFAVYLAITGVAASRCGRTAEARRLLWRAWRLEPATFRHAVRLIRSQLPIRRLR